MAKLKKGTFVVLDKNYKNVCVGDTIMDAEGFLYEINSFGVAVNQDGSRYKVEDLGPFELCRQEPVAPEPEQPQEEPETKELDYGPLQGEDPDVFINEATDQMLADELRRRGYEVKATKTTIVEL